MNETIKLKIKAKTIFAINIKNRRFENDFLLLVILITELNELINISKAL